MKLKQGAYPYFNGPSATITYETFVSTISQLPVDKMQLVGLRSLNT